jgi:preprotein translocase subunit SecG
VRASRWLLVVGRSPTACSRDENGVIPDRLAVKLSTVIWIAAPLQISSALTLIFLVLLHSGKGGGLSDMFGGGAGAAAAGSTVVERNLDRITVVAAVVFFFSSVAYALVF